MVIDTDKNGKQIKRFINVSQIQQVYQADSNVIVDLVDYTQITVINQNLDTFMERFI
jgi:hypothetical protein